MESEEDAKDTIMDLKLKKRSFNGTPVKARLKTDPGLRSYYTAGTVLPIAYPGMTFQPYGMVMDPQGGAVAPYSYDTTASGSPSSPQSKDKSVAAGGGAGGYRKDGSDGDDAGRRDGRDRVSPSSFPPTPHLHLREPTETTPRGIIQTAPGALVQTASKAVVTAKDLEVVIAKRMLLPLLPLHQLLRSTPQQTSLLLHLLVTLLIMTTPLSPQPSLGS
jgi:hypothetical protein